MKRVARINAAAIIMILVLNLIPVLSFAEDTKWVQDKPARLVSFMLHSEIKCSVCGKTFASEHECVRESDMDVTQLSAEAGSYYYYGSAKTGYDCSGKYYCVSDIHCYVEVYINGKFDHNWDCNEEESNHLKSHGLDSNGSSADFIFVDSSYYGEKYKPEEGHYETAPSTPTTPATPANPSSSSDPEKESPTHSPSVTPAKSSLFGVTITKVTKGKKSFTAKWKKASKKQQKQFNGYQIQYSTSPKFTGWVKTKSTTKKTVSKVVIRKLKKKTTYYVRMRRYKKSGGKKIYSDWSKVKTVKTK